jgi:hypothetical protein
MLVTANVQILGREANRGRAGPNFGVELSFIGGKFSDQFDRKTA